MDISKLQQDGFLEIPFEESSALPEMQNLIRDHLGCNPPEWHKDDCTQEEYFQKVKSTGDKLIESGLYLKLLKSNLTPFKSILGPDIEIQSMPHLRLSRPGRDNDVTDWHRDTFYGNTPWEMNLWFPIFPLGEGTGLALLNGSHREPSKNVHERIDSDKLQNTVKKGSVANQAGYVYAAKSDDTIAHMNQSKVAFITPQVGTAVFFFGCMAHRAFNRSESTRVSVDLRLRSLHAPTETKNGYYQPLCRGVVENCIKEFFSK